MSSPTDSTLRDIEHAARNAASTADAVRMLIDKVPLTLLLPLLDRLCDQTRELILMANPRARAIAPTPKSPLHVH